MSAEPLTVAERIEAENLTEGGWFREGIESRLAILLARALGTIMTLEQDKGRLDWMQERGAAVHVEDTEVLCCTVDSSVDYRVSGFSGPQYDIRVAVDAAMAREKEVANAS